MVYDARKVSNWEFVPYDSRRGWVYRGKCPVPYRRGWWPKALRVVAAAEGANLDTVVMYDAAILSAGPVGANIRFNTIGALAEELILHDPMRWAEEHGACLANPHAPEKPFAWLNRSVPYARDRTALCIWEGGKWLVADRVLQRVAVFGTERGNIGLTREDAGRSLLWGMAWASVLSSPTAEDAIIDASIRTLERFITDQFPGENNEGLVWLAMAVSHPAKASRLSGSWTDMLRDAEGMAIHWRTRVQRVQKAMAIELAREAL